VLIAAVIAFPASWRARTTAIGLGFLAIQAMNIVRIISLFYLGNWNLDLFSWVHLYLWPALIIPTLAPTLLWAWQSRDTPLLAGVFNTAGAGEN